MKMKTTYQHKVADLIQRVLSTVLQQESRDPRLSGITITDVEALIAHCTAAVQAGIAFDDEEAEIGVACVGVLLLNEHHQPLAGLSISAPAERRQAFWGEKLLAARDQLAVRMGFASPEVEPQ